MLRFTTIFIGWIVPNFPGYDAFLLFESLKSEYYERVYFKHETLCRLIEEKQHFLVIFTNNIDDI